MPGFGDLHLGALPQRIGHRRREQVEERSRPTVAAPAEIEARQLACAPGGAGIVGAEFVARRPVRCEHRGLRLGDTCRDRSARRPACNRYRRESRAGPRWSRDRCVYCQPRRRLRFRPTLLAPEDSRVDPLRLPPVHLRARWQRGNQGERLTRLPRPHQPCRPRASAHRRARSRSGCGSRCLAAPSDGPCRGRARGSAMRPSRVPSSSGAIRTS